MGERRGLLDFDLGASSFELLLDLLGFGFRHARLDDRACFVDQALRFGKTETGHDSADFLDDSDLLSTTIREDDVELSFFFCSRSGSTTTSGGGSSGNRSGGGNAPLLFQGFHKFSDLKHSQSAKFIYDLVNISHFRGWYRRGPEHRLV